ncbi:Ribokinase [anaerobic digester metagenome]|nr:ribokinase [Clostridiaceae bacterium HFYG-1003]
MKICCFGSLNIDMVFSVHEFVQPKETIQSKGLALYPGGKGLNQAMAIKKSGATVLMAGSVGPDGAMLLEVCDENGLDRSLVRTLDIGTGTAVIQVNDTGENCIILYDGANKQNDTPFIDTVLDQLHRGDFLVLQNEVNNLGYLITQAHEKGIKIFLNPSPIDETLKNLPLNLCDYLIVNEVEGQLLSGETAPDAILTAMSSQYPNSNIILTLGADGVHYTSPVEGSGHQRAFRVKAVDTTGAGDAFTGYFIGMTAKYKGMPESIAVAQKAAAISVTRKGAAVSIPYLDEVMAASMD